MQIYVGSSTFLWFMNHFGHLPEEFALTIAALSQFYKLTILTIFLAHSQHFDEFGHLVSHKFILNMLTIPCAVHTRIEQRWVVSPWLKKQFARPVSNSLQVREFVGK
jgi:hypothetical protein